MQIEDDSRAGMLSRFSSAILPNLSLIPVCTMSQVQLRGILRTYG
jgi:hypothetical protein